ncbi:MAG: glycosyltransferase [Galbitalea sp.]
MLHGHVPDAVDRLDAAAVLLLTSRHEGQPLVILEALARGCPVVAYDVHYGPGEMIEDGRSGLLVEPGDVGCAGRGARGHRGQSRKDRRDVGAPRANGRGPRPRGRDGVDVGTVRHAARRTLLSTTRSGVVRIPLDGNRK